MVRKSERNKAQGTPEKLIPERTRKSTRQSLRRKKKSSSESEGEPDVVVDKDIKEVGELSESKLQTEPEGPEVKEDGARTRRSVRRQPAALQSEKEQDRGEQNNEWEEDASFWKAEGPAPQETGESKVTVDDGITWKIQSSNGSGGEIQKLKICRQRVTESNDSPSPTKEASPRRRKSTRSSKNLDTPSDSRESLETINEVQEECTVSQGPIIPGLENNEDTEVNKENVAEDSVPKEQSVSGGEVPDSNLEGDVPADVKDPLSDTPQCNDIEPVLQNASLPEEEVTVCDKSDVGVDNEEVQSQSLLSSDLPDDESSKKSSAESEQAENVDNQVEIIPHESTKPDEKTTTEEMSRAENNEGSTALDNGESITAVQEGNAECETGSTQVETNANIALENEGNTSKDNEGSVRVIENKIAADQEKSSSLLENEEITELHKDDGSVACRKRDIESDNVIKNLDKSNIQESPTEETNSQSLSPPEKNPQSKNELVLEDSNDNKGEKNLTDSTQVKSPEEHETSDSDEVLKKLNARAARFSKDLGDNKKKDENVNIEPKSPREEGELTPVLETKKSKHTTIVINRPKEVSSQPTKLKRNTDDLPPSERKRRLVSKPKSKDKEEDPFNISSQSLMLLVPEVKTITPEQVASFPLDDEDLSKFEMEQPSELTNKKNINMKNIDVEVRVQNENRQVVKKKQIVIDATNEVDEMKAVGPKLPLQENHRVVRKISLLTEDVKKPRRSPSPSGKPATEVLFITNLVRPFTIPQLRELLARTGTIAPNGFYIDKIKSKCYVKYTDVEMAVETRHALNGVRWPVNNPKMLKVEFATSEDMALVQKLAEDEVTVKKPETAEPVSAAAPGWLSEQAALKPQRRVTTAVREWDMGKVGMGATEEKKQVEEWPVKPEPPEVKRRAASPVETKYEPPARKIKKRDNDAPARLLDDLFRKTKATPCIYWLPLTAAQIAVKEEMRRQHMAEHERRLAELRKSDHSRRDKDREKSRDSRRKK